MSQSDLVISHYAAAFIDVLGQRDQLRGCGLLPDNKDEIISIARKTIATVLTLHSSFEDFYSALTERPTRIEVPDGQQHELERLQKIALKYQRFSDGLVVYLSLMGDIRPELLNGLYGVIGSCGSLCLLGLTRRSPIRGGVDVAWGVELNNNELYGCVVAKAYELESEIAKWPRVVVGEHVVNYLNLTKQQKGDDVGSRYDREMASVCMSMLARDSDGAVIIDYLGPGFKKYIAATLDMSAYEHAYSFVEEQIKHWGSEKNDKLLERYKMLKEYFDRNRGNWVDAIDA